jgi:uncharacterized protein
MKKILLFLVRAYQVLLSPIKGSISSCRFYPSCSHYSLQAIQKYGARKGFSLSVKRIIRCNPWNPGGYDPVP